jgi:hypothetical protein
MAPTGKENDSDKALPRRKTRSNASRKRKAPPSPKKSTATPKKRSKPNVSSKQVVKPMPAIAPVLAMIARDFYKNQEHVLAIGHDTGTWDFDLTTHLSMIQATYTDRDLFLVGYRDEERFPIKSIDEHHRVNIPFFAVHALPRGAPQPNRIVSQDLLKNTERFFDISELSMKWTKVASFPTGQEVHMLVSVGRTTSRALKALSPEMSSALTGGQFWFPIPLDYNVNPGQDFTYKHKDVNGGGDDAFFFAQEIWELTLCILEKKLKNEHESLADTWKKFCGSEEKAWLATLLPVAVDKFFEYEEDLPREDCEGEVTLLLAAAFKIFKQKLHANIRDNEEEHCKDSLHFKVYPENALLREYMSKDCSHLSKWCGKVKAVYPPVQPPAPIEGPIDLWGA